MKLYCMGIRVNAAFAEVTCQLREHCSIYRNTNLREAFEHPKCYEEADVYNKEPCRYNDYGTEENGNGKED